MKSDHTPAPNIHLFNAMNYVDSKAFLLALNKSVLEILGKPCKEAKAASELSAQVHANLKATEEHNIVVVDELDAFIGKTKDAMSTILDLPIYAPKTILIGRGSNKWFV